MAELASRRIRVTLLLFAATRVPGKAGYYSFVWVAEVPGEAVVEALRKHERVYVAEKIVEEEPSIMAFAVADSDCAISRLLGEPQGNNVAGVDVNADRVDLAITDTRSILRDIKAFHYQSLASPTLKGDVRRSLVHRVVHDALRYVYFHGASTIVFEDLEILGYLKLKWIMGNDRRGEKYNCRVSMFKSSLIEELVPYAPEYGLKAYYTDPEYTSQLGELVAREVGLGSTQHQHTL